MVSSALRAPDHGGLIPWRLIQFSDGQRESLATLFEQEKHRRDPNASDLDLDHAREHATRVPTVLAFVIAPIGNSQVPDHEQLLSAGAALGNFLLAAHALGYGAIVLSGERCKDTDLCRAVGVKKRETLAGFISLGTIKTAPPLQRLHDPNQVLSAWSPISKNSTLEDVAVVPQPKRPVM